MTTFEGTFYDEHEWPEPIQFGDSGDGSIIRLRKRQSKSTPEFDLARWLDGRGYAEADECEQHVRLHCEMNDIPFDDFWIQFEHGWENVKYTNNGRDNFADACEKSKRQLIEWPDALKRPTKSHHRLTSLAVYLNEYTRGNPFLLPCRKVGEEFGLSQTSISRICERLQRLGLIICVEQGSPPNNASKYVLGFQLLKYIPLHKRTEENLRVSKKPEDFGSAVPCSKTRPGWPLIPPDSEVPF